MDPFSNRMVLIHSRFVRLSFVLVLVLFAKPADAVFSRGGGLGDGARAMGMGGAFVSVADDPSAAYWNPAGLVTLNGIEIGTMYGSLFNDKTRNTYFSVHYPTSDDIHIAVSVSNLFFTELTGPHEDDYSASIAIPLLRDHSLSAGLNVHYLYADLKTDGGTVRGMGADLGFLYRKFMNHRREFRVGLCITDLSTSVRFKVGNEQPVPRVISPGISFAFNRDTLFAMDFSYTDRGNFSSDKRMLLRGGLEHWLFDHRVGFRTGYIGYSTLPGMFSLGTSYRGNRWSLDYAFMNHPKQLGNSHRVSAGWKFGRGGELEDSRIRPYHLGSLVGDSRIQLTWNAPEGVEVDGYWVYFKMENDQDYQRAQQGLLKSQQCILRGAQNGSWYKVYVTAIIGGKESPRSGEISVTPRPMSLEAKHFYDLGVRQLDENKLSASLYATRKAEELDPNNYEIKELLRKLVDASKKGLVGPGKKP